LAEPHTPESTTDADPRPKVLVGCDACDHTPWSFGPRLSSLRWPVDRDPAQAGLQPLSLDLRDLLWRRSRL